MRQLAAAMLMLVFAIGLARAGASDAAQDEVRDEIARQLGPGNSYALVIGISSYDKGWNDLPGAATETAEIGEALSRQGFTLVPAPSGHVTIAELRKAITEFTAIYGGAAENRLVIYVASHGAAATDGNGSNGFLVASDTPLPGAPEFSASAYSVAELSGALLHAASQHVFLFFNACFSGAMVPDVTRSADVPDRVPAIDAPPLSPDVADWTLQLLSHNARLVLTAGSDGQEVPDRNNPYAKSIIRGLMGEADSDADGLILGTELAQFVRGRVARETRALGAANDPVFAALPKVTPPPAPRPDAPSPGAIDYRLQGDFIFLSPIGAREKGGEAGITERRNEALPRGQFTDCPDCPVMIAVPGQRYAMARTETTFAEWDACYRELGCRRWIDDNNEGRGNRPAQGIAWADALEFVQWLNRKPSAQCAEYRLPSPDEWTLAALAGSRTVLPWGDTMLSGKAVCWGCGEGMDGWQPNRTASLPANAFGLHDMIGNLWEWTRVEAQDCGLVDLLASGTCDTPGTMVGGSYATRSMQTILAGSFPRGLDLSLPTIGLRAACTLRE